MNKGIGESVDARGEISTVAGRKCYFRSCYHQVKGKGINNPKERHRIISMSSERTARESTRGKNSQENVDRQKRVPGPITLNSPDEAQNQSKGQEPGLPGG